MHLVSQSDMNEDMKNKDMKNKDMKNKDMKNGLAYGRCTGCERTTAEPFT